MAADHNLIHTSTHQSLAAPTVMCVASVIFMVRVFSSEAATIHIAVQYSQRCWQGRTSPCPVVMRGVGLGGAGGIPFAIDPPRLNPPKLCWFCAGAVSSPLCTRLTTCARPGIGGAFWPCFLTAMAWICSARFCSCSGASCSIAPPR